MKPLLSILFRSKDALIVLTEAQLYAQSSKTEKAKPLSKAQTIYEKLFSIYLQCAFVQTEPVNPLKALHSQSLYLRLIPYTGNKKSASWHTMQIIIWKKGITLTSSSL